MTYKNWQLPGIICNRRRNFISRCERDWKQERYLRLIL